MELDAAGEEARAPVDDVAEVGGFHTRLAEEESGGRNYNLGGGGGQQLRTHGEDAAEVHGGDAQREEEVDGGLDLGNGCGNQGWVRMEAVKGVDAERIQVEEQFLNLGVLRGGRGNGRRSFILRRFDGWREDDGGGFGGGMRWTMEVLRAGDRREIGVVEGEGSGGGGGGGGGEMQSILHGCYMFRGMRGRESKRKGIR